MRRLLLEASQKIRHMVDESKGVMPETAAHESPKVAGSPEQPDDVSSAAEEQAGPEQTCALVSAEDTRLSPEPTPTPPDDLAAPADEEAASCAPENALLALQRQLDKAHQQVAELRAERKRWRRERGELLHQTAQLYCALEAREAELREFIRNDAARATSVSDQLESEREERERERWSLLRHARDEAERSLALAAQLEQRDAQLAELRAQLRDSDRESLASATLPRSNGQTAHYIDRCSADSGLRGSSDRETSNLSDSTCDGNPQILVDMDNVSLASSANFKESPSLSPLTDTLSRSVEALAPSHPHPSRPMGGGIGHLGLGGPGGGSRRGGAWGSISRVFARTHRKHRMEAAAAQGARGGQGVGEGRGQEMGYADKLRLLREASCVPMDRWKACAVLAWVEVALGMPQYGPRCAENVKSGRALLALSDADLEAGLGVSHPMHRKKLRLAIEEQRHPDRVRHPAMSALGHTWVSSEWLPDLGLAQHADAFASNMVDARMLDQLSKRELEKYLGVTRRLHQASLVHGVRLLRMLGYDRCALASRRACAEASDVDPLVWTNQRFMRWCRAIDLAEFADNLKDSGVHGALVVLEPSFTADSFAAALGIPPGKLILRRHLAAELDNLLQPALRPGPELEWSSRGRLHSARSLSRSSLQPDEQRSSFKGSLSRALGLRSRAETCAPRVTPSSSSESPSNGSPCGSQSGTLRRSHRRVKSIGDIDLS